MRSLRLPLALLLSVAPLALGPARTATGAPPSPADAGLELAEINDRRAAMFPRVTLTLVARDLKASEVRGQKILLKGAVDDTGANLLPDDAADAKFELSRGALAFRAEKEPATFRVELMSPARTAKSLKDVSGRIELYVPGRDPASAVTFQKLASWDGRALSDPALSANGVEVTVLGPKGVAAERKAAGEAARKAARAEGKEAGEVEQAGKSAEESVLSTFDPKWHTVLKVRDPNDRIGAFAFIGAGAKEFPASSSFFSGYTFLVRDPDVGEDPGLRILLKTPRSLLVRPFALKDVPLP